MERGENMRTSRFIPCLLCVAFSASADQALADADVAIEEGIQLAQADTAAARNVERGRVIKTRNAIMDMQLEALEDAADLAEDLDSTRDRIDRSGAAGDLDEKTKQELERLLR